MKRSSSCAGRAAFWSPHAGYLGPRLAGGNLVTFIFERKTALLDARRDQPAYQAGIDKQIEVINE